MNDHSSSDDVLGALARYAPSQATIDSEWSADRRGDLLAGIVGAGDRTSQATSRHPVHEVALRFLPTSAQRHRTGSRLLPVVAATVVLAAMAAILVAVLQSPRGSGYGGAAVGGGPGPAFDPPANLSSAGIGATQYSYLVDQQIDLDVNGAPIPDGPEVMIARNWVSTNGDIVSMRSGSQSGCFTFPHSGTPGFDAPTQAFFQSLPTDPDELNAYIRDHVQGSSSHDEAVFVAVGDALRIADGLASPRLRGALVGVLSRTPGVSIHENQLDYLGRPALRADFVDQRIRPGEVHSYYFDPATFQLLEERQGLNSQPGTYDGPSPAYDAPPAAAGDDPLELTGAAYVEVTTVEKVADTLPAEASDCPTD